MSPDPNKKVPRQFQCRESLWQRFEQMAKELECSVDYLINDAMKQYARQRGYSPTTPSQRSDNVSSATSSLAPVASSHSAVTEQPPPQQAAPNTAAPAARMPTGEVPAVAPRHGSGAHAMAAVPTSPPIPTGSTTAGSGAHGISGVGAAPRFGAPPLAAASPALPRAPGGHYVPPAPPGPAGKRVGPPPLPPSVAAAPPPARAAGPPPLPPGSPQTRTLSSGANAPAPAFAATPRQLLIRYQGQSFPVTKDKFVIGRGKQTSDLTIKDPNVSRQHGMIEFDGAQYCIVDLGSTNGIEYRGQRVQRKILADGAVIRICDHELVFQYR